MPNETLARRYATAIFSLAEEAHSIEAVGKELRELSSAIAENETAKEFFVSPVIERSEKERVLGAAFEGKTLDLVFQALLLLVRKHREKLLPEIAQQYQKLEMQHRGVEPAFITSARRLRDGEVRAIVSRLEAAYGKKFEPSVSVDPALIGGVRVLLGDRRIDGTIDGRLQEITRKLFAQN